MPDPTLYEILFRFDGDGKLQGAHAQYISNGIPGPAIPLSLAADDDKPTVKEALGAAMTSCLEAKEAAEARATELEAKVASVAGVLDAKAEIAAKDANIQALLAENEALLAENEALRAGAEA